MRKINPLLRLHVVIKWYKVGSVLKGTEMKIHSSYMNVNTADGEMDVFVACPEGTSPIPVRIVPAECPVVQCPQVPTCEVQTSRVLEACGVSK